MANENKLKELADYALYKDTTLDALPKFKFNGALIRDFKEVLMPEISSIPFPMVVHWICGKH